MQSALYTQVSNAMGSRKSVADAKADIKPQNILIETSEINRMFEDSPSESFAPRFPPEASKDFYQTSAQLYSDEEDLETTTDVSVRLTDFDTGMKRRLRRFML
jgi:hypothetical protein